MKDGIRHRRRKQKESSAFAQIFVIIVMLMMLAGVLVFTDLGKDILYSFAEDYIRERFSN